MKNLTAFFIATLMLLYVLPYGVLAQGKAETPTIAATSTSVRQGGTVDVDISISNNPGIVSLNLGIGYDVDSLVLTGAKKGTALVNADQSSTTFSPNTTINPYKVIWVTTATENVTENGIIATLTFKVKDDANLGQTHIDVTCKDAYAVDNFPVAFNVADGYITVVEVPHYTVSFIDWDNELLGTCSVIEGGAATAPSSPKREGHVFKGWDKDFSKVMQNLEVKAVYDANKYTVTFKDWDGEIISTLKVEYGKAATAPEEPIREGYTFVCWNNDFSSITHDLTVTAQYSPIMCVVRFLNWNGKLLRQQTVQYGKPAQPPTGLVREGYTFSGWDKDVTVVKADISPTAQYTINTYTVSYFVDGTLHGTQRYDFGAAITAMNAPQNGTDTFSGWSDIPETMPARNISVYGTFIDAYTVIFEDYDGTVLSVQSVEAGNDAQVPPNPTRVGYEFMNWDKETTNVSDNMIVTAVYVINTYEVKFLDYDDTLIGTVIVEHGKTATAPQMTVREGYKFAGWDKSIKCITSNLTVKAQYTLLTYKVTFVNYDDSIIETVETEYGKAATAPQVPAREGYRFKGWDTDFSSVKSDLTVKAEFEVDTYTVTFKDYDGSVLKTQEVMNGEAAEAPENPYRQGYIFKGWDRSFDSITADTVITATYAKLCTVTFVDSIDNTVIDTQIVEEGQKAMTPKAPEHEGYTFIGWDKAFDIITADIKVMALYDADGILGDVNLDKKVNTADAVTILRSSAGLLTLTDKQSLFADTTKDGKVNTGDAVAILRLAAGLITEF